MRWSKNEIRKIRGKESLGSIPSQYSSLTLNLIALYSLRNFIFRVSRRSFNSNFLLSENGERTVEQARLSLALRSGPMAATAAPPSQHPRISGSHRVIIRSYAFFNLIFLVLLVYCVLSSFFSQKMGTFIARV